MNRFNNSETGSALILAFVTIIALAGTSAALLSTSIYRNREAAFSRDQGKAFYIADSGITASMAEITANTDSDGDGMGDISGAIDNGTFAVEATHLGDDVWSLRSVGIYGPESRGIAVIISRRVTSPFTHAAFGGTSVDVSGNSLLDSYDSDDGTYASQVSSDHANENGGVGSNGDITAIEDARIYGDATPGPYGSVTVTDAAYVTGSTAPAPEEQVLEPYIYEPVGVSAGSINSSLTLTSGTHRYSNIKLVSEDSVVLGVNPGDEVTIYIDDEISLGAKGAIVVAAGAKVVMHHGAGKVSFTGQGLINTSQIPGNFIFYSATTSAIKVAGSSDFYGAIYAPFAPVTLAGTSAFFGAVVGDTVAIVGTSEVHYDEALADIQITSKIRYQVNAWHEFRP